VAPESASGGWLTFHRHVLDYFWTTPSAGIARGYYQDGRIVDVYHYPGETRHFHHGKDEYFVHAIENVGDTELIFVTVEFLRETIRRYRCGRRQARASLACTQRCDR